MIEDAIPQYVLGHRGRVAKAEADLAELPGLILTGNAYRGLGLKDCLKNSLELARELSAAVSRADKHAA